MSNQFPRLVPFKVIGSPCESVHKVPCVVSLVNPISGEAMGAGAGVVMGSGVMLAAGVWMSELPPPQATKIKTVTESSKSEVGEIIFIIFIIYILC
jgi:hypothetical protein